MSWEDGCVKLLLKISRCLHWVPMAITFSLFIGFEHMSMTGKLRMLTTSLVLGVS
jgi:hypothetical protein